MNLFHIDTETTGFDPKKHEIFNLAFAIEIDGVTHCKMDLFMRPEKWDTIDQRALDSNGWAVERLKRLPCKTYAWMIFLNLLDNHVGFAKFKIIEYGNNFDSRFLKTFCDSQNWSSKEHMKHESFFQKKSINVLSLAKKKLPGLKSYKLKDVARRLGIPVDDRKLHGAAYDRDLMMGVYNILKWR